MERTRSMSQLTVMVYSYCPASPFAAFDLLKGLFIFIQILTPMQLMMYIGNDLIASITLDRLSISRPGYLGKIKRQLIEQYNEDLQMASCKPEFLIIDLPAPRKGTASVSS